MKKYYRTPQQAAVYARRRWEQRRGLRDRVIRQPKTALELSTEEKVYLACLMDTEGCITLNHKTGRTLTPTVVITNTSILFKQWVMAHIPFGTWKIAKHTRDNPRWKPCHFVTWHSANAIAVIEAALPYFVLKKENANIVLKLWHMEESYLKAHDMCRFSKHLPVPPDIKAYRTIALTKIRELNKKGRIV